MENTFNPLDWIEPENRPEIGDGRQETGKNCREQGAGGMGSPDIASEVDTVISRIESAFTDITTSYNDWLNVGFAFAHEFGEAGRSFFQRVSRFYPGFSLAECNKQYDHCLKSTGHGITIKTFFHMAKQAGIEVKMQGAWGVEHGKQETGDRKREKGKGNSAQSPCSESDAPKDSFVPSSSRPLVPSSSGLPSPVSGLPSADPHAPGSMPPASSGLPSPLVHAPCSMPPALDLPTFPDDLFPLLPRFLQRVVERSASKEERDMLLLGSLTTLSACLYKVFGVYDDKKVFPNLYLYVTAKASAGKGRLVLCKRLVQPIHWALRDKARASTQLYEMELREFNLVKNKDMSLEKPVKPPELLLFIPANSSSTGMFQLLSDNDGRGLIFETEGDTLAQAFKTDYGNYSDGFRKAFHHETITYYRRTDREYVEILSPCVSALLSGTPSQIASLIPNAENGLFSRFLFYYMNLNPQWKDVFKRYNDQSLDDHFNHLGQQFLSLYSVMNAGEDMEFCLSPEQEQEFNLFFTRIHEKYLLLQGVDYLATIRRLGLNAFRMAMILSALRLMETGDFTGKIYCQEEDFQSVLAMIQVLVRHASHVYAQLPEEVKQVKPKNKQELFLEGLPERFSRKEYMAVAKSLELTERTAQSYMTRFCEKGLILHDQHDSYVKINVLMGNESG